MWKTYKVFPIILINGELCGCELAFPIQKIIKKSEKIWDVNVLKRLRIMDILKSFNVVVVMKKLRYFGMENKKSLKIMVKNVNN